ncbi:MAG: DUF4860 domain-containing protein [Oscillospiraceae bacterium]|nr:DUF4860 domain-containing protein [Oscillospiraceae bacterium]
MNRVNNYKYSMGLPALFLFLIISVSGISLITCGVAIHNKIEDTAQSHYTLYTGAEYLSEKIRQSDSFSIEKNGEADAIKLNSGDTVTYVYVYRGFLREYNMLSDAEFIASAGQKLLQMEELSVKETDGIFDIALTDTTGKSISTKISILGGTE